MGEKGAARIVEGYLVGERRRVVVGSAAETGLPSAFATVVYGEATLTMQSDETKRRIVREAARLLWPGGRYAIRVMYLRDGVGGEVRKGLERALTGVVHQGVRPLAVMECTEWRHLLESEGFEVKGTETAPVALLEPARVIRDEGFFRALRFVFKVSRDADALPRVFEMRKVFRSQREQIAAIVFTATRTRERTFEEPCEGGLDLSKSWPMKLLTRRLTRRYRSRRTVVMLRELGPMICAVGA